MIVVIGYLTIDPNKRAAAEAAIAELVPLTEAEDGCVQYRYSVDLGDPNRINIIEQWESDAAIDAHIASDHMATFMGAIGDCLGGPLEIVRHDVATSTKLF